MSAGGYVKRLMVGRAISSHKSEHQLLPKFLALPVFSSDPLSSVAYATEEMMLVLVAGRDRRARLQDPDRPGDRRPARRSWSPRIARPSGPIRVAAAPTSWPRRTWARSPGLTAAAAILIDYVLTVAVSVTAGTVAITSAAPSLSRTTVPIAIGLVLLVTLANLRGVKEAGTSSPSPLTASSSIVARHAAGRVRAVRQADARVAATADLPIEPEDGAHPLPAAARVLLRRHRAHRRRGDRRRGAGVPATAGEERGSDAGDHGRRWR